MHKIIVLFITDPPYIDFAKIGIPPAAISGEVYNIECPYESNPPAQYEWYKVPSCGSIEETLSSPIYTIRYNNNNKTLRLDGILPLHYGYYNYGYYNCSATNAFGSKWVCWWRKVTNNNNNNNGFIADGKWLTCVSQQSYM